MLISTLKVEHTSQSEDELVENSNNVEEKNVKNNNMCMRMRNHPRLRFKSRVIQTSFAWYSPKKKMIPK